MDALTERMIEAAAASGLSGVEAGRKAGLGDSIAYNAKNPTLFTLERYSRAVNCSPAWLAYGDQPSPVEAMSGYHARPVNRLSDKLEAVFSAWEEDGLGLKLFTALERTGLRDGIYLLSKQDYRIHYDHIGMSNIHTLGYEWWTSAHGQPVGESDPDPEYAYGCLRDYRDSLESKTPLRHRVEVTSFYTGEEWGWIYDRLLLPFEERVLVVNEVRT